MEVDRTDWLPPKHAAVQVATKRNPEVRTNAKFIRVQSDPTRVRVEVNGTRKSVSKSRVFYNGAPLGTHTAGAHIESDKRKQSEEPQQSADYNIEEPAPKRLRATESPSSPTPHVLGDEVGDIGGNSSDSTPPTRPAAPRTDADHAVGASTSPPDLNNQVVSGDARQAQDSSGDGRLGPQPSAQPAPTVVPTPAPAPQVSTSTSAVPAVPPHPGPLPQARFVDIGGIRVKQLHSSRVRLEHNIAFATVPGLTQKLVEITSDLAGYASLEPRQIGRKLSGPNVRWEYLRDGVARSFDFYLEHAPDASDRQLNDFKYWFLKAKAVFKAADKGRWGSTRQNFKEEAFRNAVHPRRFGRRRR